MTALVVRPYRATDREALRALLVKTFGSSEVFDRFEVGNPLGTPVRAVAELDGVVVGLNQWVPWLLWTSTGIVRGYQSGASAVDESARGKGVFGKLLLEGERIARAEGVEFFFGFPNPASYSGFIKAGWMLQSRMPLRIFPVPTTGSPFGRKSSIGDPQTAEPRPAVDSGELSGLLPRFLSFRYGLGDIESRRFKGGGVVYFRRRKVRGATLVQLLDVLVDGRRDFSRGFAALRALPLLAPVVYRSTDNCAVPFTATIPRKWSTPLVIKSLRAAEAPTLCAALGDIDFG